MGRVLGVFALLVGVVTLVLQVVVRGSLVWWLLVPALVVQTAMLVRLGLFVAVTGPQVGDRRPRLSDTQADQVLAATEVAVIATGESLPTIRTALVAAIDAVPAERVMLVSADERHADLARSLAIRWVPAEAGWHPGLVAAVDAATGTFLAITSASTALVARTLSALARYLDRRCAWVQTSAVSPEQRRPLDHVDQLVVGPTTDGHRVAAWNGAGSLVQVAAIRAAGLQHGTLGATIALQARGWHGRGVRGTLALPQNDTAPGGAVDRAVDEASRRLRLLIGRRSPLWARRLPWRARVVHLRTMSDDLAGSVYALGAFTMVLALLAGQVPVPVELAVVGGLLVTQLLAVAARWEISSGLLQPGGLVLDTAESIGVSLGAVAGALGRTGSPHSSARWRRATSIVLVALEAALAVRAAAAIAGGVGGSRGTDLLVLLLGVAVLVPLLVATGVITRSRLVRASRRAPAPMPALLGRHPAQVVDLGADGIGLVTAAPVELLSTVTVRLLPGDRGPIDVRGQVVRVRAAAPGSHVGVRLVGGVGRRSLDDYIRLWIDRVSRASIEWPRLQRGIDRRAARPAGRTTLARLATAGTLLAVGVANLPPYVSSRAASSPAGFTLQAQVADSVLYGVDQPATVTACNAAADTLHAVAVRAVLPEGATLAVGTGRPSPAQVMPDQPTAGSTTVLWEQLGVLRAGDCVSITFGISHLADPADTGRLRVGDRVGATVEAFASSDPTRRPEFEPSGVPVAGEPATRRMATTSFSSSIVPVQVSTEHTSGDGRLLRGRADRPDTFAVRVVNTEVRSTDDVVLDQYLPDEMELQACAEIECSEPAAVNTVVVDPDGAGPLPAGRHTQVRWELGALEAGAERTIVFAAGVAPRAAEGADAAEAVAAVDSEPVMVSVVSGTYTGWSSDGQSSQWWANTVTPLRIVDTTLTLSACNDAPLQVGEVVGATCSAGVAHDGSTDWTLAVANGGSGAPRDPVLTLTLGAGLALGAQPSRLELGVAADADSAVELPAPTVRVESDGTQTAVWSLGSLLDPGVLERLAAPDASWQIRFTTTTLAAARGSGRPVAVADELPVVARLESAGTALPSPAVAVAHLSTGWPEAAQAPTLEPVDASDAAAVASTTARADASACASPLASRDAGGPTLYRPGALACFELRWVMPTGVAVRDPELTVELPTIGSLEWFGTLPDHQPASTVAVPDAAAPSSVVRFEFGSVLGAGPRFLPPGQVVHLVVAMRVAATPPTDGVGAQDLLARAVAAGATGPAVAASSAHRVRMVVPEPSIALGVVDVVRTGASLDSFPAATLAAPTDLIGGDEVTVRVQVGNSGAQSSDPDDAAMAGVDGSGRQAADAVALDVAVTLPDGLGCDRLAPADPAANVAARLVLRSGAAPLAAAPRARLSDITCTGSELELQVDTLPAGYDLLADLTLELPSDVGAGTSYTVAGAVGRATATADFAVAAATQTRTFTTAVVDEAGNDALRATIGEIVTATYTFTLPARTTVYAPVLGVDLPTGLDHLESTVRVTASPFVASGFDGADAPAGWSLDDVANGWRLTGPVDGTGWRNESASAQEIVVQYRAKVADVVANRAGTALSDALLASWRPAPAAPSVELGSPDGPVAVTVVEPALTLSADVAPPGARSGGDAVTLTLTVANDAGAATAHQVEVEACADVALGPIALLAPAGWTATATPAACAAGGTAVRFSAPLLEPGESAALVAAATLAAPAIAGTIVPVAAEAAATSLAGSVPGERTVQAARSGDAARVALAAPLFDGAVSAGQAAPGQNADHLFTFTVPARTRVFDATVVAVVASGLSVMGYTSAAPAYGPSCSVPGTVGHTVTPVDQNAGWFLGDVVAGESDCVVTMGLSTRVRPDTTPDETTTVGATVAWDDIDRLNDVTEPTTTGLSRRLTAATTVTAVGPALQVSRSVDDEDRAVEGGQAVQHTITLTNDGSSAAFHIDVTEDLPSGVAGTDSYGGTCDGAAAPSAATSGSITWTLMAGVAGLEPGASCTLTYVARTAAATALTDEQPMASTIAVGDYFGAVGHADLAAADRRTYRGSSSTISLTAMRPTLRVDLAGADGSERASTRLGEPSAWEVQVRNVSSDGARTARGVDVALTLAPNWTFTDVIEIVPARCAVLPAITEADAVTTVTWTNMCDLAPGEDLAVDVRLQSELGAVTTPGLVADSGAAVVHEHLVTLSAEDAGATTLGSATNTAGATIESVDLQVVTTDASAPGDGSPTGPGMVVGVASSYFVDARNNGPATVDGSVTVTDTVPAGFLVTAATGDGWTCAVSAAVVCTHPGPVAAGANLPRLTITGVPTPAALNGDDGDADPATGLAVNRASISSAQVDHRPGNDSDDEPTPVRRVTDLAISAVWSPSTPLVAGAEVRATVTVVSVGPSAASGEVRVIDELPTGMRLVRVSGIGWNCGASRVGRGFSAELATNGVLNCFRRMNETAPGTVLDPLDVLVQIDPTVMSATSLQATVAHANDPEPSNNSVLAAGPATPSAVLSVRLDDGADRFAVGQRDADITVVATNQGPSAEAGPVEFEVTIPEGASPGAVDAAGWDCASDGPSAVGTSRVRCTFVGDDGEPDAVAVGQMLPSVTIDMEIGADAVSSPDPRAASVVGTSVSLTGVTADTAATASLDTPVEPRADVVATVDQVGDEAWTAGGDESYAVVVSNRGPNAEYGPVRLTMPLPVGVSYLGADGDGWNCLVERGDDASPDLVVCTAGRPTSLAADAALLEAGERLDPLVLDVAVGAALLPEPSAQPVTVAGSFSVVGTTDSSAHDGTAETAVTAVADLVLERAAAAPPVVVGEPVDTEWRVTNLGPNASAAGVVVTDQLPDGLDLVDWSGTGWACTRVDSAVRCEYGEVLAVGDTAVVQLTVQAAAESFDDGTPLKGGAVVEGPHRDPRSADNEVPYEVVVDPLVDLAVSRRSSDRLVVGRTVPFEYEVRNTGPTSPESTVTLTNDLPAGLRYTEVAGPGWECVITLQRFDCTRNSRVGSGDPLPAVVAEVMVESIVADGASAVVSVSAPWRDADTDDNVSIETITVVAADSQVPEVLAQASSSDGPVVVADDASTNLSVVQSMWGSVQLGERAAWAAEVVNDGPATAYDVVLVDTLPMELHPIAAWAPGGRCVVAERTVRCAFESLAAGATRAVTVATTAVGRLASGSTTNTVEVRGAGPETRDDDNRSTWVATAGSTVEAAAVDEPSMSARWVTVIGVAGLAACALVMLRVVLRPRRRRGRLSRA